MYGGDLGGTVDCTTARSYATVRSSLALPKLLAEPM